MTTTHYFDTEPTSTSRPGEVSLRFDGSALRLQTDRGVFARLGVDRGTRLLIDEAPPPPPRGDVVDLGCGYGPIAIALATRAPGARVWAVDVNRRALDLVRHNATMAGVTNVTAATPDQVPPDLSVTALYSNPPVRIGKDALHRLLGEWLDRLAPGAAAHLVVQRHLGSDSLARWLGEQGHRVSRLRSRAGYRLLEARRPPW